MPKSRQGYNFEQTVMLDDQQMTLEDAFIKLANEGAVNAQIHALMSKQLPDLTESSVHNKIAKLVQTGMVSDNRVKSGVRQIKLGRGYIWHAAANGETSKVEQRPGWRPPAYNRDDGPEF